MNLESGDAFEQANSRWIRENLPYYEPLWSKYIGNSGHGRPLDLPGLQAAKVQGRKKFYQAHYTAVVGCFEIEGILSEINSKLGDVTDISGFLRENRHLVCFMGYLGQVRDMYKFMDEALGAGGTIVASLQDFYSLRSHIIHGPRMPVRVKDGFIQIPKVARQNKTFDEWDDKSYWDDFAEAPFVYIADFCEQTKLEFFQLIRAQHAKVYSAACEYFGDLRIESHRTSKPSFINASTAFPAISAWIPPSGYYRG